MYLVAMGWFGLSVVSKRLERSCYSREGWAGRVRWPCTPANSVFTCGRPAGEVSDVMRDMCEERGACDESLVLGVHKVRFPSIYG